MAAYVPQRVWVGLPLTKSYMIIEAIPYSKDENVTICKYVKRMKSGDVWEDKVVTEFVSNPKKIDLLWLKIEYETRIAE